MSSALMGIEDLAGVLVQCFALILLGYVSGRVGLISETESKGLSNFVSYFSLPALIFTSIATTNLSDICWKFVTGIFISKTLVFVVVAGVTMLLTKPYSNTATAGLYSILCTQSNDFAIGYPIITSLYSKTHPEFANYLYVLAPIQLIILNPVGIFMMEIHKAGDRKPSSSGRSPSLLWPVFKGVFTNPVIVMTLLGLVWNLTVSHTIPIVINGALTVLSQSFSAAALFLLGLSMVGKFKLFTGSSALLVPLVVVATKILILPLITWFTLQYAMNDATAGSMANFGFLYATFPPAPTVFIFALQYGLSTDVVATGMVLGTVLSAPVMFVSANVIRLAEMSPGEAPVDDLATTMMYVSLISIPACTWTLGLFILNKRWKSVTHRCTMALLVFQLCNSIGGLLWNFINISSPMTSTPLAYRAHFILSIGGTFSTRIWTALLSTTVALLHWKSLCYVIKLRKIMNMITALSTSLIFIIVIFVFKPEAKYLNPNFELGSTQAGFAVGLLVPSLMATFVTILLALNYRSKAQAEVADLLIEPNEQSMNDTEVLVTPFRTVSETESLNSHRRRRRFTIQRTSFRGSVNSNEIEDINVCLKDHCVTEDGRPCCDRIACDERIKEYKEEVRRASFMAVMNSPPIESAVEVNEDDVICQYDYHQVNSHLMLLLILMLSMFLGLVVSLGKMMTEVSTGAFLEIEYLDILLNYGQGIVTFVIFGFDASAIGRYFQELFRGSQGIFKFKLPSMEDLSMETKTVNEQFRTYHLKKCKEEIEFELHIQAAKFYVFRGHDLVDWLIKSGLSGDRKHAVFYGRHLVKARTIEHFNKEQDFHDAPYFYRFVSSDMPDSNLASFSTYQSISNGVHNESRLLD